MGWFSHPKGLIIGIDFSYTTWKNSGRVSILPSMISVMRDKETPLLNEGIPSSFMLSYDVVKTTWLIGSYDNGLVII